MYVMEESLLVDRKNTFISFHLYVTFPKPQSSCGTRTDEYEDISFDSCEEIESEEPGSGRTSTEEHRVAFDKNGKQQKVNKSRQIFYLFTPVSYSWAFLPGK